MSMMLDLQLTFREIGGFGVFQMLVCIAGSITCCFGGSVISAGAFTNLVACSTRHNATAADMDNGNGTSASSTRHGFRTSVSVEYNLCDDRAPLGELSSVFLLIGCIPGSLLAGPVADLLGRIPGTLIGLLGSVSMNVLATFSPHFWLHLAARLVCGFFISWTLGSIFVYGNEVLMTEHRSRFVKLYNLGPAVGSIMLALFAYSMRNYKLLMTANNFIALPAMLIVAILPESPSWLMSRRNRSLVKRALGKIAWMNGFSLPDSIAQQYPGDDEEVKELQQAMVSSEPQHIGQNLSAAIKSLLSDRRTVAHVLSTCYYGFSSGFSYYGFTFVITHAVPNIYTTVALSGAVESTSLLLLNACSRSQTLFISALATVAFCLAIGIIFTVAPVNDMGFGLSAVTIGLAVGGKFVSNIAFCAIVAVGAEIFPTAVRNTGLGLLMAALRTGCMLSPMVNFIPVMPARFGVLGLACLVAAFPVRALPDTRTRDLTGVHVVEVPKAARLSREFGSPLNGLSGLPCTCNK